MKFLLTSVLATTLVGCAPKPTIDGSNLASVSMEKTEGCLTGPIEQFGRYIGDWDIQTWSLSNTDSKTWTEGKGARWNFTCVGDGIAVQDFWMPNGGGIGTNLRIYDPKEEKWDIAWTATNTPGFSHINAKEDVHGNIVMHYVSPQQTPARRITFMPPSGNGWDWKLELADISGETKAWREVFRIKATKRAP